MKTLLVLARIILIGALWSIIFIEGVRVIMLENWRFDIFWPPHWLHAWNLWLSGWVIDTAKEWAFVLILLAFLPLWLTGWISLSLLPWEVWIYKLIALPFVLVRRLCSPLQIIPTKAPVVIKKKSYKEIRPTGPRTPIYDYSDNMSSATPTPISTSSIQPAAPLAQPRTSSSADLKQKAAEARQTFSHSVFSFDDEEDDFDLDFDSFDQSDIFKDSRKTNRQQASTESVDEPRSFDSPQTERTRDTRQNRRDNPRETTRESNRDNRENRDKKKASNERNRPENRQNRNETQRPNNPVADVLTQKGYDLIGDTAIQNTIIDFIGVADDKICVCLIDKEPGDWLADEERFNNEEPLWFSESSHRVSPVRKADLARKALSDKLEDNGFDQEVRLYVIIQSGNIINAEDMFDTWRDMNVFVTRINRGSPKEIALFSKTVEEADTRMDKSRFNELKKLVKTLN